MTKEMDLRSRRMLIVESGSEIFDFLKGSLDSVRPHLTHVSDIESAVHRVLAWKPHIVIVESKLLKQGQKEGEFISDRLRSLSPDEYLAVVSVGSPEDRGAVDQDIRQGADDYLVRPLLKEDMLSRLYCVARSRELFDQVKRAHHRIEELATSDEQTGVSNMKFIYRQGEDDIARCRRFRKPVSALIVDVDHFSSLNETHGFPFGSEVLHQLAGVIRSCVRRTDRIARIGADEFFVLLPETDLAGAQFVAERIRDTVHQGDFKSERESSKISVSIGVSGFAFDDDTAGITDMYRNSSEAMRAAKAGGGNKVEVFSFA